MAKQIKNATISNNIASSQPFTPYKKAKVVHKYDPETVNSDIEALHKGESLNGEDAKRLAKAAKERGKSDGFIAGALVVGIAWASHAATTWVMEKFSKA